MTMEFRVVQEIIGRPYRLEIPPAHRHRLERLYLSLLEGGITTGDLREKLVESGEVSETQVQAFDLTMETHFFLWDRMVDNNFLLRVKCGDMTSRKWLTQRGRDYLSELETKIGAEAVHG
jgi:hypothetical protein